MTTILSGGNIVLADRIVEGGSVVVEGGRIVEVRDSPVAAGEGVEDITGHLVVPGFIDVHVHGVEGKDTLTTANAVAEIAARLPAYGVTGFCPMTVACGPVELQRLLDGISAARSAPVPGSAHALVDARVLDVQVSAARAFAPIRRIGGARGWYYATPLWHLRAWADLLAGGVGMRRGRRDPETVAEKLVRISEQLGGVDRISLQMTNPRLAHADLLRGIELLGTEVAPRVSGA